MEIRKADEQEWNNFIKACPATTFFHTPQWYRVWHQYAGYGYEARIFQFESGRKALLPLSWKKRITGLMKEYISSPAGTYGGFLVNEPLSEAEIEKLEEYIKGFASIQIRENPFQKIFEDSFWTKSDFTQSINLDEGLNSILKNWSKGHTSAFKKGIREGVKVRLATEKEWLEYFEVYKASLKRWGKSATSNYPWQLFELLREISEENCKLWLAVFEEKPVAGCLCFYQNKHVVYWHGASLEAYFKLRPVHVLQYHIIKNAIESGHDWYDFNPSGGHEGVVKFKKGFGAEKFPANVFQQKSINQNLFTKIYKFIRV